jgi:hypothetical protein
MVSMLTSSVVDRGFEPRSVNPKTITLVFVAARSIKEEEQILVGSELECVRVERQCLSADCCFSELALLKSHSAFWSRTKRISSSSHWKLTCSRLDIAEKLLSWHYTTVTHSLTPL